MTDLPMTQARLGPVVLAPGVRPREALAYIAVSSVLSCISVFMGIIQPYIFTEHLNIPSNEQGRLTGDLAAVQQIAGLLLVTLFGALSDRFGRRLFLILAMIGMTAAILLYPVATLIIHLFLLRFLFGAASTCNTAGGPAMRMDLTDNNSRGRFLSYALAAHAVATTVLVSWMGTRLPAWLAKQGVAGDDAGRYTFWIIGFVGIVGALIAFFGLRRDRPSREPLSIGRQFVEVGAGLKAVFAHARVNPRFRLILIAASVLRADSVVIITFVALWVINAGKAEGLTTAEALRAYGAIAMVMTATDLIFGIIAGFVADRMNRMRMLLWSIAATGAAFASTLFIDDVTGPAIIVVVVFINLAEAFLLSSAQSAIGEETPPHLRGSGYGVIAFIGMVSVVIVSAVCGRLVDAVGYKAPFLLMALLSGAFLTFAAYALRKPQLTTAGP